MFNSARIKLTAWYLLIIMLISISFSVAMYKVLASELDRFERIQRVRIENRLPERNRTIPPSGVRGELSRPFALDPDLVAETKYRLIVFLTAINCAILGISAAAGYFLAGRTLKPIKEMVDEQNRFITDASHELRTPLTSLKSEIEVAQRDKNLTLSEAKELLESNLEEVNNLQILSDNLIKLTQYQKTNNNLALETVSIKSIIDNACKKVAGLAKAKGITIKNDIDDLQVEIEKNTFGELFVILLDNAIKYSPKGGKVFVKSKKTDSQILIEVKDQGAGIDSKDIPHLFDRFYRSDKSRTKSKVAGYGLGLAIAKQIVDKHKGSIKVESEITKGTTFTIQIPQKH